MGGEYLEYSNRRRSRRMNHAQPVMEASCPKGKKIFLKYPSIRDEVPLAGD